MAQEKKLNYTKGPWYPDGDYTGTPPEEQEGNARLILAAPEMYEFLCMLRESVRWGKTWRESNTRARPY